jgi:RND family efflux transporter MFP subunit
MIRILMLGAVLSALCTSGEVSAADNPTVLVQTAPLARQELAATISGYGLVSADPMNTTSINFPHAGQVVSLPVNPGELVSKGTPLVEIATSPADAMTYSQALTGVEFARKELARVRSMADKQLATASQVGKASKDLMDAEAAVTAQRRLGTDSARTLVRAPYDGIVSAVNVAPGDRIQPGATVLQLARRDRLKVVIGIEPEQMRRVKRGMPVRLSPVFDGQMSVAGRVEKIYGMINPQTRLVDVSVSLKPGEAARLVPGLRVRGVISLHRGKGYAVPRQAVLKDARGSYIFVVRERRAHRVDVTPGIENGGVVGISGALAAGERVVILGNYELREGMAVREGTR